MATTEILSLVTDLEQAISERSDARRVDTLRRITDLFLMASNDLNDEQVDVFGVVIERLTVAIETGARADLAERLADVRNAPCNVIRALAHDTIAVARPVLTRSSRLSDIDLVEVALAKGQDHMLAISQRSALSEVVTDVLVSKGDRSVAHSIASNPAARLSNRTVSGLIERARADDALKMLLSQRIHVSPEQLSTLLMIAKEAARRSLVSSLPEMDGQAISSLIEENTSRLAQEIKKKSISLDGGPPSNIQYDYTQATAALEDKRKAGGIHELDVAEYAQKHLFEESVCALALAMGLSIPTTERLLLSRDMDLLLIICKAKGWAWSTARALLKLRGEAHVGVRQIEKAMESYDHLVGSTAQRVLRFLHIREGASSQG